MFFHNCLISDPHILHFKVVYFVMYIYFWIACDNAYVLISRVCNAFMSFGNCLINEAIHIFFISRAAACDLQSLGSSAKGKQSALIQVVANAVNACIFV